jgi:hypothetical protein
MGERRPRRTPPDNERVIRASEISQYVYCAHAWWLKSVEGLPSAHQQEMERGEAAHLRHGCKLRTSLWLRRLGYVALLLAALAGCIWLINISSTWLGG